MQRVYNNLDMDRSVDYDAIAEVYDCRYDRSDYGPGTYTLTAGYPTFYEETRPVQVVSDQFTTLNFGLDPIWPGGPIPMGAGELPGVTAVPQ